MQFLRGCSFGIPYTSLFLSGGTGRKYHKGGRYPACVSAYFEPSNYGSGAGTWCNIDAARQELADRLEKSFAERQNNISGMVVIGASEAAGSQTLAKLIKEFSEKYPAVQFTLYNETVDNVKDRLDKGLVDIGLLLDPIDVTKFDYVRLSQQDTWGLLVRDDHPLMGKESLAADDVAPYPLILPLRDSIRAEILNWLGREEKELKIPLFYTLLSNAALMVAEGLGCAFCMDGALAIRSDPRLRFIPLEPRRMTHSVLVWKKNNLFSPAASLFIQEIHLMRARIE